MLEWARGSGRIVLRAEILRELSGWPVYAWYFLDTPASLLDQTVSSLRTLRQARLVAPVIGRTSVMLAVWLHSIDDVQRLEIFLEQRIQCTVRDRSIVLRTPLHLHLRLDASGRRIPPPPPSTDQRPAVPTTPSRGR